MSNSTVENSEIATDQLLQFSIPDAESPASKENEADEPDWILPSFSSKEIEKESGERHPETLFPDTSEEEGESFQSNTLTSTKSYKREELSPVPLRKQTTPLRRFEILQQWEGVVDEVKNGEAVWATLFDLSNQRGPSEHVEIPFEEIPKADQSLLGQGSVFYWSIGYEHSPGGQTRRVSEIRLKRTSKWSKKKIKSVEKKAQELMKRFQVDDQNQYNPSSGQ